MHILYPELSLAEREERLKLEAKKKEMRNYKRTMQPSEIDAERARYSNDAIEKRKIEKQMENIVKDLKGKISSIAACMEERLEKIDTGKTEISGTLYGLPDFTNKRMLFRDKFGELVDSRDLLPDEMTGNLFAQDNNALKDLPFETAKVVEEITDGGNLVSGPIDMVRWHENEEVSLDHATDDQLIQVYGTTDMDVIRSMVWDAENEEYVPASDAKKEAKSKRGKK